MGDKTIHHRELHEALKPLSDELFSDLFDLVSAGYFALEDDEYIVTKLDVFSEFVENRIDRYAAETRSKGE